MFNIISVNIHNILELIFPAAIGLFFQILMFFWEFTSISYSYISWGRLAGVYHILVVWLSVSPFTILKIKHKHWWPYSTFNSGLEALLCLEFSFLDPMPYFVYTYCVIITWQKNNETALHLLSYSSKHTWNPCVREKNKKPCNFWKVLKQQRKPSFQNLIETFQDVLFSKDREVTDSCTSK